MLISDLEQAACFSKDGKGAGKAWECCVIPEIHSICSSRMEYGSL